MNRAPRSLALAASALVLPILVAMAPAEAATPSSVITAAAVVDPDPSDRESMRQGYLQILKPAIETPTGWDGDLATCDAGAPSAAAQEATLTAVNYFRDLVGVEPVVFDAALSAKAQEAALMMARNGELSHDPDPSWECFSDDGHEGASRSNIHMGHAGADAIADYMVDPGSWNFGVGHRRWIIDPRQTTMGSGSVEDPDGPWSYTTDALYVVDVPSWQPVPAETPTFMPWPVAGYMPIQIEPDGRWSLSAKGAVDFSQAAVTVNGSSSGITVHPVRVGSGPNTLAWNFDPAFVPGDADRTYHVVVSGIQGAPVSSHAYDVTLFDANYPPGREEQTISFSKPADRTYGAASSTLTATASSGLPVTFSSKSPTVCSTSGAEGRTLTIWGAGTCTIAASQAGDDSWARAPEVLRAFAVAKKQLTVTAVDTSRAPDEPNPPFDVVFTGFAYGQTLPTSGVRGAPSCSTTATSDSPPGTYPISCSTGTLTASNYTFTFQPGTLTIGSTEESQTIDFIQPADRTYGAPTRTLEAWASSNLAVTFTSRTPAVCSTSGTDGRNVSVESAGTCTIAANQAGDDTYGPAPEVQRSFTIAKRQLTGQVRDAARKPGEANPAFEVDWSGFAYSETLETSGVTGTPSCATSATSASSDGTYPVTCSVGTLSSTNYSFAFQSGTLTVDGTAPQVSGAGDVFTVALGEFSTGWRATDPSGVDGIQERERTRTPTSPFGSWSTPSTWDAGAKEWAGQPQGGTLCLSARARDSAGNISGWSGATCVHTPVDSASLKAPRAWRTVGSKGFWNGSALSTRKKGTSLKLSGVVDVDRVGIVASRCSRCGKVGVYVGKTKIGSLSLNGQKVKHQVVLTLPRLQSPLDGTVKVVVESTRRTVQIDGIVVSGSPTD